MCLTSARCRVGWHDVGSRSSLVLSYHVKNVKPLAVAVFAVASAASFAHAQTGEHVAVVINEASPASTRIAEHYIRVRSIPPDNVIRIQATTDDTIDRSRAYLERDIEQPITWPLPAVDCMTGSCTSC